MEGALHTDSKVDAILPAGGRIAGAFAAEVGTEVKALISLGRRTILEHTLEVLRATGRVGRVVVIGPAELEKHPATRAVDAVLLEGDSGPENIFRGMEWLHQSNGGRHADRVLVVTTDLPFLTSQAITGFLDVCSHHADVCLPIIRREAFQSRFPDSANTYVQLRDGHWTLGCAFLFDPVAVTKNRIHIDRIFAARKSTVAMARLLGPLFIARFVCRRLTVPHVQQRCEQILGCTGAAVLDCAPELAFDIDLPDEYRYALQWIKSGSL